MTRQISFPTRFWGVLLLTNFPCAVPTCEGVSEDFWRILAPVIGGSLHNFRYLSEKANDPEVPNVATPKNQKKSQGKVTGNPQDLLPAH